MSRTSGDSRFRIRLDRSSPFPAGPSVRDLSHELICRRPFSQISPDKDVNFRCTTAAFTLSLEPGALLCCANLPGDWALYAVSVRRLTTLHSGLDATCSQLPHCGGPSATLCFQTNPRVSCPCRRLMLIDRTSHGGVDQGSHIGDLHPISSRPCRAYTFSSSGRATTCALQA